MVISNTHGGFVSTAEHPFCPSTLLMRFFHAMPLDTTSDAWEAPAATDHGARVCDSSLGRKSLP